MPLNDFRNQISGEVSLDSLGHCADRYGVSLTAAILKWLSYTDEKAVVVMSRDGFMNWASASTPAFKAGAFYKTKNNTVPIPNGSLTANDSVNLDMTGIRIPAKVWFPHADSDADALEMKCHSEQYDCTITLIILPRYADYWPPKS